MRPDETTCGKCGAVYNITPDASAAAEPVPETEAAAPEGEAVAPEGEVGGDPDGDEIPF